MLYYTQLLHCAYCGVTIAGSKFGTGSHIAEISHHNLVIALKLLYIGNFFVILAISISKTSFAMTLLGIAVEKWHYWLLWSSIVSVNLIMALDAIFQFTQCTPIDRTWDLTVDGECWDTHIVVYYSMFAGGKPGPPFL
jgi:hypothetical protein